MMKYKILENNIEAPTLAELHNYAFSNEHFSSNFSNENLVKYYMHLIDFSDLSILFYNEDNPIGFIVSGYHVNKGVNKFVSENRYKLALILIRKPRFLFEKLTNFIHGIFYRKPICLVPYRLLSIAVNSNESSKGFGTTMLSIFEEILKKRNINEYGLSVRLANKRAIKFYDKNIFILEYRTKDALYLKKSII